MRPHRTPPTPGGGDTCRGGGGSSARWMAALGCWTAALLLLLLLLAAPIHAANLQFGMRAGWSSTSMALEASEFFTDASQYFSFIQQLQHKLASSASYPSEQAQYNASLSAAGALLGAESSSLSVLRASLQLRLHSPAVETLRLMRVNRVARAVADIPFDHEGAQELKDAREREWLDCPALVALAGTLQCGTEGLNWNVRAAPGQAGEALEHEPLYAFDHVYPGSAAEGNGTPVVLYADPMRAEFGAAHAAIVARMDKQPLRYVLRPSQAASTTSTGGEGGSDAGSATATGAAPLSVQGFGVELAIKNMEYKVLDDSTIQMSADDAAHSVDLPDDDTANGSNDEGEAGGAGEADKEDEVSGFNFRTLKSRRPELRAQLDQLRDLLLREAESGDGAAAGGSGGAATASATGSGDDDKKPAVWELKDLGFQAAQRVLASAAPLEMLRDLSQNFPMYARALTRTRVNATAKLAVEKNVGAPLGQGQGQAGPGTLPPPGTNLLDINGLTVELGPGGEELDYFAVLELLAHEARSIDDLAALHLTPRSVSTLLQKMHVRSLAESADALPGGGQAGHSASASASPFLLHMGLDSPSTLRVLTFLNDIESDSRYRSWPPSLREFLTPSWPNQLKYVRRNSYTGVGIADPSTAKGLDFLTQARFFINQNAPIRIGFVFWIPGTAALQAEAKAKVAAAGSANGVAKKTAAAAAPQRGLWNSDLLSKVDGPWAELVDDEHDSVAASTTESLDPYSSPQARVAKVFFHLATRSKGTKAARDREQALDFLQALHDSAPTRTTPVSMEELQAVYKRVTKKLGLHSAADAPPLEKLMDKPELNELVQLCIDYSESRGIVSDVLGASSAAEASSASSLGQMPLLVVNGVVHRSAPSKSFRDVMMGAIMPEQHRTMYAVYRGEISDRTKDIHAHWQSKPNVLRRINNDVATPLAQMKFLPSLPPLGEQGTPALHYWRTADADADSELGLGAGASGAATVATLSYWIVCDWGQERGLDFVNDALEYVAKGHGSLQFRLALVHNPAAGAGSSPAALALSSFAQGLTYASPALTPASRFAFLRQAVMVARYFRADGDEKILRALKLLVSSNAPALNHLAPLLEAEGSVSLGASPASALNPSIPALFLASSGIAPGASAIVLNGRVISLDAPVFQRASTILPDLRLLSEFTSTNFELARLEAHVRDGALVQFEAHSGAHGRDPQSDPEWMSEVFMRCSFVLLKRSMTAGQAASKLSGGGGGGGATFPKELDEQNSAGMIRLESSSPHIVVRALVDPLSKTAQKLAPVLLALRDQFSPRISILVWLSPRSGLAEFPLKRFYRYALSSAREASFDESTGALRSFPGASFRNLRTKHILSTVVFTPESWGVRLASAKHDLDNLNVAELGGSGSGSSSDTTVHLVQYELENLLLFGQCIDPVRMEAPAGLQLMLGSAATPWVGDTVVMQNLGYFQLKAGPGEWTVSIADERHARIYEIQPEGGATEDKPDDDGDEAPSFNVAGAKRGTRQLFIRSFNEGFVRLDVLRKPGQERAQLLDPSALASGRGGKDMGVAAAAAAAKAVAQKTKDQAQEAVGAVGSLWSSVFGSSDESAGGKTGDATPSSDSRAVVSPPVRSGETIHVFSLASGHLYERFLKIMMLSVLDSTRNPVKFWFLANFASPQFRDFVPRMARELGFEAEFVTYKWPVWLRRQEEKQRIIWGYKILFLDVLFPLAVPRVIYIDADQVVRGDIAELWNMDLQGAPYAYTPFCSKDPNPDTTGFRFWASGYWADHLRGKPYHISALYVVDLDRFRSMRAGDTLRGIYDNLSADPNSLANLDQDLPNFSSHQVPIHSLPQEWLWCQTWCSMDSLSRAKTIDLCNNPLTKTPKLEVAKQLLPEWTGLDARAKQLEQVFADRAAAKASKPAAAQSPHVHVHSHRSVGGMTTQPV